MTDLSFAGYRSFDAAADDPLRVKWNVMRSALEFAGLSLPVPALWSVNGFNLHVNRMIAFNGAQAEALDAWQSPAQTLTAMTGDCKDFALLKYAALMKAGIQSCVVIGEIKNILANQPHAWVAGFIDGAWRALDNKFDQIVRVDEYINWLPIAALHDASVMRFGPEFTIAERLAGRSS